MEIRVRSGDGGDGIVSFHRGPYQPRGGPDGGDGGRGGNVVFKVDPSLSTLTSFRNRHLYRAQPGGRGGPNNRTGAKGADVVLPVPPGTVVRDAGGEVLADLTEPGQEFVACRGGRGGRGNARFATATNRAPRMAEKGEPGRELVLKLELKLLADVGLVGMPNAGKSTLLAQVSAARPKTAPYPFTTLQPQLGVVPFPDGEGFVMADIPGLIEGAHAGVGLGHQFLRHIERTRVLVYIVDAAGTEGRDPLADLTLLRRELGLYHPRLLDLPSVVALNKMDLPEAQEVRPALEEALGDTYGPVVAISAATGMGVDKLLKEIRRLLAESPPAATPAAQSLRRVYRPRNRGVTFEIEREDDGWRVTGATVERWVAMTDLENEEALRFLWRRLRRIGLAEALRRAGAEDGDTIYIGQEEFTFSDPEAMGQ